MKFELIGYPQQIVPGNEYQVSVKVTPELFGLITTDWIYFYEEASKRRTTIYKDTHFNRIYYPYALNIPIKLEHISQLTDDNIVLGVGSFNGPPDPLMWVVFGGEGIRTPYSKKEGTYYPTGETEKTY